MKFTGINEFSTWLYQEIVKISQGWLPPSKYEEYARIALIKISVNLIIPSPFENGGWKGIDKYAAEIWNKNISILYDRGSGSSNTSSWANRNSSSSSPYSSSASSSTSLSSTRGQSGLIQRHNFDAAMRKIQAFSSNLPSVPYLDKYSTDGGLFGWGDHYINGYEMNRFVESVQGIFNNQYASLIRTIKEFEEVYHTFDYLDREYIQGILQTANAAKTASEGAKAASNQAKTASEQAKSAVDKALKNEQDIQRDVENLRKVVDKIKTIKEDLSDKILRLESSLNDNVDRLNKEILRNTLSDHEHQMIKKLDELWHLVQSQGKKLDTINSELSASDNLQKLVESQGEKIDSVNRRLSDSKQTELSDSDELRHQLKLQEKKYRTNLIVAYAIGGLGVALSICSLII